MQRSVFCLFGFFSVLKTVNHWQVLFKISLLYGVHVQLLTVLFFVYIMKDLVIYKQIQYDVPVEAFPWLRYRQSSEDVDGQTTASDASSTAQCKQCPGQQAPLPPPVSTTPSHQDTVSQSSPPGSDSTTALSSHTKDTVLKTSACEAVVSVPPVLDDADQSQQTVAGCARKSSQGEALNSEFQCQCSLTSACVCDRKASLVDKAAGVCGRTAVACIENRTSWTSGNSQAGCLTIAEAGRNMRHCEEDDSLVCCDGTRLQDHLEKADGDYFQQFLLPDKELRMFVVMDVVHPSFRKSSCFTKRYLIRCDVIGCDAHKLFLRLYSCMCDKVKMIWVMNCSFILEVSSQHSTKISDNIWTCILHRNRN